MQLQPGRRQAMCGTDGHAEVPPVEALPAGAEWTGEVLSLEPVDELSVLTVCDNTVDMLLPDQGPARRLSLGGAGGNTPPLPAPLLAGGEARDAPLGQHGFSALVEIRKGGRTHRLLFDTGVTPTGCVENLLRLGQDPAGIEAIVCSHGHFDHTTGLSGFIGRVGRANLPVLIHPEFWTRRRLAIPGRDPFELPTTSRLALNEAGFDVIEQRQPSFLYDRSVLITGEVDRITGFEKGFAIHQAWRGSSWQPDPLILDDQALIANVAGRGLVVLTGCGHAGVINICRYAQRLTGIAKLHAVIGGFHLSGPLFEPIISDTVSALEQLAPDVIVPAHCTGWKATHAIARRLPDAFFQSSVGTTYRLSSAGAA
jgi:7,8-dihydropterin-6-yl-methyl-4-(beta-D-ribofuranosyl)aminobenzene 5'-phosphate synthase